MGERRGKGKVLLSSRPPQSTPGTAGPSTQSVGNGRGYYQKRIALLLSSFAGVHFEMHRVVPLLDQTGSIAMEDSLFFFPPLEECVQQPLDAIRRPQNAIVLKYLLQFGSCIIKTYWIKP